MNWIFLLAAVLAIFDSSRKIKKWIENYFAARAERQKRQRQKTIARQIAARRYAYLAHLAAMNAAASSHDPSMG